MKFLTTGAFAKLCGTQKGTLLFYDKEGLLKPKYVSENGYRRYGVEQFYDFDVISMLKKTGSSLKEIKSHLKKRDPEMLLALFEEKKNLLKLERAKLARQQKMLDDIISLTREALHMTYGVLEVMEMKEEALELMHMSPEHQGSPADYVEFFAALAQHFESQGRYVPAPFGIMVKKEDVLARQYIAGYFFCGVSRWTPESARHVKPKGRYAVFSHAGNMDSHQAAYVKLLEDIEKSGLRIAGNIYAYDTMSYFVTGSPEEYLAKYCVRVE